MNNAGWHPGHFKIEDISVSEFEQLLRTNLTSTFMGCKFAVPHLRKVKGTIVNIASLVAAQGQKDATIYVATKAGQVGLTKALAIELAEVGVRVNAVGPAGVDTPLLRSFIDSAPDPVAALQFANEGHPLGRIATAEEIGEVCAFLASDESSFITGQTIFPDGGAMLGR